MLFSHACPVVQGVVPAGSRCKNVCADTLQSLCALLFGRYAPLTGFLIEEVLECVFSFRVVSHAHGTHARWVITTARDAVASFRFCLLRFCPPLSRRSPISGFPGVCRFRSPCFCDYLEQPPLSHACTRHIRLIPSVIRKNARRGERTRRVGFGSNRACSRSMSRPCSRPFFAFSMLPSRSFCSFSSCLWRRCVYVDPKSALAGAREAAQAAADAHVLGGSEETATAPATGDRWLEVSMTWCRRILR